MSLCIGNRLSSLLRYLSIRSRNSSARATEIDLPAAILVAPIRSQIGMVTGFRHTAVSRSRVTRVRVRVQISEPLPTPPPVTAGKGFDGGYECLADCLDCRIAQIADWQV